MLLCAVVPLHAAGLPDTGQFACYTDTAVDDALAAESESVARDTGTHPRQDCRYGPDAAAIAGKLAKVGAGAKGFDYTKIANNGAALAAATALGGAASDWACTRDNITGLTWEIKASSAMSLRYQGSTYTWYNPLALTNGGDAGTLNGSATCLNVAPLTNCNTQDFAAAVNAGQLCTYSDWRLPTRRELLTLVKADGSNPAIDSTWFPNTPSAEFWTSTTYVPSAPEAWLVIFTGVGRTGHYGKAGNTGHVRLVRGAPF